MGARGGAGRAPAPPLTFLVSTLFLLALLLPAATAGEVRLAECRANDGCCRVEVEHAGEWGTVCDDGWGAVVCRELQCSGGTVVQRFRGGTGKIWMDSVNCAGTEVTLSACPMQYGWGQHDCSHQEDAGACCTGIDVVSGSCCAGARLESGACQSAPGIYWAPLRKVVEELRQEVKDGKHGERFAVPIISDRDDFVQIFKQLCFDKKLAKEKGPLYFTEGTHIVQGVLIGQAGDLPPKGERVCPTKLDGICSGMSKSQLQEYEDEQLIEFAKLNPDAKLNAERAEGGGAKGSSEDNDVVINIEGKSDLPLEMIVGKRLKISLATNPSTGKQWQWRTLPPAIEITPGAFHPRFDDGRCGGDGKQIFTLKASVDGDFEVELFHARKILHNMSPSLTLKLKVHPDDAAANDKHAKGGSAKDSIRCAVCGDVIEQMKDVRKLPSGKNGCLLCDKSLRDDHAALCDARDQKHAAKEDDDGVHGEIIEITDWDVSINMRVGEPQQICVWCGSKEDFEVQCPKLPTEIKLTPVDVEDDFVDAQLYELKASASGSYPIDLFFRALKQPPNCHDDSADATLILNVVDSSEKEGGDKVAKGGDKDAKGGDKGDKGDKDAKHPNDILNAKSQLDLRDEDGNWLLVNLMHNVHFDILRDIEVTSVLAPHNNASHVHIPQSAAQNCDDLYLLST